MTYDDYTILDKLGYKYVDEDITDEYGELVEFFVPKKESVVTNEIS